MSIVWLEGSSGFGRLRDHKLESDADLPKNISDLILMSVAGVPISTSPLEWDRGRTIALTSLWSFQLTTVNKGPDGGVGGRLGAPCTFPRKLK